MKKPICTSQQHTVTFQGRNPGPTFLTEGGEVLAAPCMHQTKASVLIVNDDLIAVQPTDQSANWGSNSTRSPPPLFGEQVKVSFTP
jgi:hypothetical protein